MPKIIKDVEQPRSGLAWSYNDYKPSAAKMAEKFTIEEQRAEYINLYYESQERLQDLREAGYEGTETSDRFIDEFKRPENVPDSELAAALSDVADFIHSERSTPEGMAEIRAETIETLQSHGYDVSEEDYEDFYRFMNKAKKKYGSKIWSSEQVAEAFISMRKRGISGARLVKNAGWFIENEEEVERSELAPSKINPWSVRAEERRRGLR